MTAQISRGGSAAAADSAGEIRLYTLAWACHDSSVRSNSHSAYCDFRENANGAFSLGDSEHRKLLIKLLNRWRCRLTNRKRLSERLRMWGKKNASVLMSFRRGLLHLDEGGFRRAATLYDTLRKAGGKGFRAAATAKTLFAINPEVFPPWDRAIRAYYIPKGTDDGAGYAKYMRLVKCRLEGLVKDARRFKVRPGMIAASIGHPYPQYVTLVKLVDEFMWVTVPRPAGKSARWCAPPVEQLRGWLRWSP